LRSRIAGIIEESANDIEAEEKEVKVIGPVQSIQGRVREVAFGMTEELEDAIAAFHQDKDLFNPSEFKILNLLKGKGAKAAHARIIREFYGKQLTELQELASGKADEQLKEGYSHLARKYVRKLMDFYGEIDSACVMLAEEAKATRKVRTPKAVSKDKVVAGMKFKKQDDVLKLVSINPTDIIGAKELWVFNTQTRKLGKYVAAEFSDLGVKGTTITGFDEVKSIQKTLRKPAEQLVAFKAAGKVALRKYLEEINAVEIKLTGRINEVTILLKTAQ
jgi:hypothetical protein